MTVYRFPMPSLFNAAMPAGTIRAEMERVLDEAFPVRANHNGASTLSLPADAREDAEGFSIELEMPGIAPEAVEVTAEDGVLTVRGERPERELAAGEKVVMRERARGAFLRRFRLPKSADAGAISATYAHGVLSLRIAKLAPAQPRRVNVTVQG